MGTLDTGRFRFTRLCQFLGTDLLVGTPGPSNEQAIFPEPYTRWLDWVRSPLILVVHCVIFASALIAAYLIRFDGEIPLVHLEMAKANLPAVVLIKLAVFYASGNHRGWYKYNSFADMMGVARATTAASLCLVAVAYIAGRWSSLPRSIVLIDWATTMLLVGGLRSGIRVCREHYAPMIGKRKARPTFLLGASDYGAALVREVHCHPDLDLRIVGILDDDCHRGRVCSGVKVLGPLDQLEPLAARHGVQVVLVTTPGLRPNQVREVVTRCNALGVSVQVVPEVEAFLSGQLVLQPRDVDIHDLLCRAPIRLDDRAIGGYLRDRVVMITGAAGSIGSELWRQALLFRPRRLVLVDHSENGLFYTERELKGRAIGTEIVTKIASITDRGRLRGIFLDQEPDVVLHAAAHKHVPMMESNPGEAVKNNVFGTRLLVDESIRAGVESLVMISTDKAVNPTSVMGACKRLAEMYVQAHSARAKTRLITVRFGNVLGSNGSVVPLFKEQIRKGGPLTVTHPEMTRYFMTIPEATQLVLQAGALGQGGEIFVLDMGRPVRIVELARDLVRLSGLVEGRDIEIVYSGLRPGEKLFEELYDERETRIPTPHPKIFSAQHRPESLEGLFEHFEALSKNVEDSPEEVIRALQRIVPGYRPNPSIRPSVDHEEEDAPLAHPQPSMAATFA